MQRRNEEHVISLLQFVLVFALKLPVCIVDQHEDARANAAVEYEELFASVFHEVVADVSD